MHSRLAAIVLIPLAITGSGLAGCNRQSAQAPAPPATGAPIASLPLAQGAPPPAAVAPPVSALPAATPLRIAHARPRERYRYIDRAYALGEAFADSPPDYTVPYQGERPWVWRSAAGEYRLIEPTPDGDRVYYYDAGSDRPFLVRDPQYAYGYDQGQLVVVYDQAGQPVPYDPGAAEWAARYDARARALYRAAVHEQREAAYADGWRERQAEILAQQQAWAADQQRDAEWRAWRDEHHRVEQAQWDAERAQRIAYAAQVTAQFAATQAPRRGSWPSPDAKGPPPRPQAWPNQPDETDGQPSHPRAANPQQVAQAQVAAAQQAAARQQADAASRAQQQAQADAARHTQAQAAQQAAAQQRAEAAVRAQQQVQAEAGRRAQAQAAQQAAAHQQAAAAAHAQQQAQAEAARHAQAAQQAAKVAAAHAHANPRPQRKDETKPQSGGG